MYFVKLIDISAPLSDNVTPYMPGVAYARTKPIFTLEKDGVESHEIVLTTLSGTYFETGRHVSKDVIAIDEVPIESFISSAVVIDVGQKDAGESIEVRDLSPYEDLVRPGDTAIVKTYWHRMWNSPDYWDGSPYFTRDALEWLLEKEIAILAGDIPSYDNKNAPQGLIRRLLEDGSTYLLAPLVNLDKVTATRVTLYAFPLNIQGVSGAPARVLVSEDQ